jgi:hypothetical protein
MEAGGAGKEIAVGSQAQLLSEVVQRGERNQLTPARNSQPTPQTKPDKINANTPPKTSHSSKLSMGKLPAG